MFEKKAKKRGRPREDRFKRRYQIYAAVAPLIMEVGAGQLTMRRIAQAANMSVSGLYHYFDSKEQLLMFPIQPEVCQQEMDMREAEIGHLKAMNPEAYLRAFIQNQAESVALLRPALRAAFELGAGDAWDTLKESMQVELRQLIQTAQHVNGASARHDPGQQARSVRRLMLAAIMDETMSRDEIRAELERLLLDEPLSQDVQDVA